MVSSARPGPGPALQCPAQCAFATSPSSPRWTVQYYTALTTKVEMLMYQLDAVKIVEAFWSDVWVARNPEAVDPLRGTATAQPSRCKDPPPIQRSLPEYDWLKDLLQSGKSGTMFLSNA